MQGKLKDYQPSIVYDASYMNENEGYFCYEFRTRSEKFVHIIYEIRDSLICSYSIIWSIL